MRLWECLGVIFMGPNPTGTRTLEERVVVLCLYNPWAQYTELENRNSGQGQSKVGGSGAQGAWPSYALFKVFYEDRTNLQVYFVNSITGQWDSDFSTFFFFSGLLAHIYYSVI